VTISRPSNQLLRSKREIRCDYFYLAINLVFTRAAEILSFFQQLLEVTWKLPLLVLLWAFRDSDPAASHGDDCSLLQFDFVAR